MSAEIGPGHAGERELVTGLLDCIDDSMLVLADRGFYGYQFWRQVRATGAQLLWRITTQTDLPVQESLPDGSY